MISSRVKNDDILYKLGSVERCPGSDVERVERAVEARVRQSRGVPGAQLVAVPATKEVGYRLLSALVSFGFFALYSQVVFILFMGNEGFFSYDMLVSGAIGIGVFFLATELTIVTFAVSAVGIVVPALRWRFRRSINWAHVVGLGVVNLYVILGVAGALSRSQQDWMIWLVIFAVSILVCLQIGTLIHGTAKDSLRSLVGVLVCLLAITVMAHKETVALLEFGLKHFGVGGNVPVTLKLEQPAEPKTVDGRLVFLSPENAYVVLDGDSRVSIIPRSKAEIISVSSRKLPAM